MSNIDKSIIPGSNFVRMAQEPLDARSTANTIEERNSYITRGVAYDGMRVYVEDDGKTYEYTGAEPTGDDFSACWVWDKEGLAVDNTVVHLAGDETISGTKTFTPGVVLNANSTLNATPSSNSHLVHKKYVDDSIKTSVPDQIGKTIQAWDKDLDELSKLTGTGHVFRKEDGTYVSGVLSSTTTDIVTTKDSNTGNIVFSLANHGTAGNYNEITVDAKGRVSSGKKHTTVEGFGITNAVRTDNINQSIAGTKTFTVAPKINSETITTKEYVDNKFSSDVVDQIGNTIQAHSDQLDKLAALTDTGYVYRKADGTIQGMTVKAANATVTVTTNEATKTTSVSLPNVGKAGTYFKVTTDAQGRVTAGSNPNTVDGFGIVDAVHKTGDTLTGVLKYSNVPDSAFQDENAIPNVKYVDSIALGYTTHQACDLGSTKNLTGTYSNGIDLTYPGVGATFTLDASITSLDSIQLEKGFRILLVGQTNKIQNGVYEVANGAAPFILVRAEDFDGEPVIKYKGASFLISKGTPDSPDNLKGTVWKVENETITFGTTEIVFNQAFTPNSYSAGTGVTISDNTISVNQGTVVKAINGNLDVSSLIGNSGKFLKAGNDNTSATWQSIKSSDISDIVPVNKGGTGLSAVTSNGVLVGNTASSLKVIAPATGLLQISDSTLVPSFSKLQLGGGNVDGILPVTKGGTGNNTGLSPSATKLQTARSFSISGGATASAVNFDGTSNVNLNVTSLDGTKVTVFTGSTSEANGTTGSVPAPIIADSGKYLSADGRWKLISSTSISGSVAVANGGTGVATIAANQLVVGNGTSAVKTVANADGILIGTASAAPTFGKANLTKHVTGILPVANGGTGNSTGNAATATKLQTARTITLAGAITGSVSFDGSGNVTINTTGGDPTKQTLMTGATASEAGTSGAVPVPAAGKQAQFLRGDATWATPTNNAVDQTVSAENLELPILAKNSNAITSTTTGSKFASNMTINPFTGYITIPGGLKSSQATTTYLKGSQGTALVNSTAAAGVYVTISKTNSTNGVITVNQYQDKLLAVYQSNDVITAGTNTPTKRAILFDENGDAYWEGGIESKGGFTGSLTGNVTGNITGTAGSAAKWTVARTITLAGNASGSVSLDGSSNVTLTVTNNTASACSGNAATATKLQTKRTIDGVSFDGSSAITHFSTCNTSAATVEKVVSVNNFSLVTGATVSVLFTITNTAANPTLNVSGTGAKPIYYSNAAISAGYLAANRIITFIYDGTNYVVSSGGQLIGSVTNVNQTEITASGEYPLIFRRSANTTAGNYGVSYKSGITVNPSTGTITATKFKGTLDGSVTQANTLATARAIDGVNFNGSANISRYAACTTAAATVAKTITISNFTLVTGALVVVKFNNGNTVDNPTLNINNTGAKPIIYAGTNIKSSDLVVQAVIPLVYDGTNWQVIGSIPGIEGYTTVESDNRFAQKYNSTIYNSLNITDQ